MNIKRGYGTVYRHTRRPGGEKAQMSLTTFTDSLRRAACLLCFVAFDFLLIFIALSAIINVFLCRVHCGGQTAKNEEQVNVRSGRPINNASNLSPVVEVSFLSSRV